MTAGEADEPLLIRVALSTNINKTVTRIEGALAHGRVAQLEGASKAISKTITIAEIVKRNVPNVQQTNTLERSIINDRSETTMSSGKSRVKMDGMSSVAVNLPVSPHEQGEGERNSEEGHPLTLSEEDDSFRVPPQRVRQSPGDDDDPAVRRTVPHGMSKHRSFQPLLKIELAPASISNEDAMDAGTRVIIEDSSTTRS
ncbi:hypothetical protein PYCC9005_004107 [Savitreella phatthalungensis]